MVQSFELCLTYWSAESRTRQGFARNHVMLNYYDGFTVTVALLGYIVVESPVSHVSGISLSTQKNDVKHVKTIICV